MIAFRSAAIAAIALAASAGLAIAQTQEDHAVHHEAQATAPTPPAPQGGMPTQGEDEDQDQAGMIGPGMMGGGMMGGGMMGPGTMGGGMMGRGMMGPGMMGGAGMAPMMRMMQGMTEMMQGMMQMMQTSGQPSARPGMMPGAMMEGRLAILKTELGITEAQLPQWDAFAAALRARVTAMQGMRAQMMPQGTTASWPDRLAQHERRLSAHLDAMKAMEGPVKALWDSLSAEQQRKAEELIPGPMGMMGRM
ncbi:Spy/CpxP family protein refolding chaperone [Acidibrevibacterium fodinaquatile]|jgi:hypothetical protein|uniref:Spy/CpxP family protein refolding chaperone n=1 Tax=Acidibrevibacterium fodinaquatile TaxID=1969806 RepID=UPI000E0D31D8|nr:Spy/CpxP family protein refolding chaperone [Acidibrevibacterium fodinaquatile]